nr:MAG TPA: hypothetical protein [Caudoviricetes sp.]
MYPADIIILSANKQGSLLLFSSESFSIGISSPSTSM